MAGLFELFVDAQSYVRFRLTAPDGTVLAVSRAFDDKPAAVAGIAAVREHAGMGHIADLCRGHRPGPTPPRSDPGEPAQTHRTAGADEPRRRDEAHGRSVSKPRWAGAA